MNVAVDYGVQPLGACMPVLLIELRLAAVTGMSGTSTFFAASGLPFTIASINWTAVPGATRYWVYRSEGHAGCNFGKAKIADVSGLSFNDTGLLNGRTYYYNVVAHGSSQACFGGASNCLSLTPERTRE